MPTYPSPVRVAARHIELTPDQKKAISYWGHTGIGVGLKAGPDIIDALMGVRDLVPPRKHKVLWRGLYLPKGSIIHSGYEGPLDQRKRWTQTPNSWLDILPPDGWERDPGGSYWFMADPNYYRPLFSGVRSWTPKVRDATYYSRHGWKPSKSTDPGYGNGDELLIEWLNPSNIYVDTAVVAKATGLVFPTDKGEMIADAKNAVIVGVRTEKGVVIVTVSG